jgi:hypothetical protein
MTPEAWCDGRDYPSVLAERVRVDVGPETLGPAIEALEPAGHRTGDRGQVGGNAVEELLHGLIPHDLVHLPDLGQSCQEAGHIWHHVVEALAEVRERQEDVAIILQELRKVVQRDPQPGRQGMQVLQGLGPVRA